MNQLKEHYWLLMGLDANWTVAGVELSPQDSRVEIQSIKSSARGFRSFENYRTRILFFCGNLNLLPPEVSRYIP